MKLLLLILKFIFKAVNRWLSKTESGVQGVSNAQKRNEIMSFFCKLKACTTVSKHFMLCYKKYEELLWLFFFIYFI